MIDLRGLISKINNRILSVVYSAVTGRVITAVLHVSPNGSGADGSTWARAYQTIQAARDVASTDANDCTLILVAPHGTFYDINTTGDPTWAGNYEIIGTHRIWAAIRNEHASATSVMKFTGKASLKDLAIFQVADEAGVIFTNSGWRVRVCGFDSTGLTGAATSVYLDGSAALTDLGIMEDVLFRGHVSRTKAVHINKSTQNIFKDVVIHECLTGVHIEDGDSDFNQFLNLDIGRSALAIDIDAGNEQHFNGLILHDNTVNVDDEVGDHAWNNIQAELDVSLIPDNFTGVSIATHANANTWTAAPVIVRAAASSTVPFKIVAVLGEGNSAEKFRVRLSADAGATWFDDISIESEVNAQKRQASVAPTATDHIFNKGTQIVGAAKCETGGKTVAIWLNLQKI